MTETFQILNPQTPMAYIPPDVAKTFNISGYMMIGYLGAFLWDIFENLHSDYRLLFQHKLSFPTFIYFFSRLSVLAAITTSVLFRVVPLGLKNCQNIMTATCVLYHISVSSTALLFFLRVRAIFNRNRYIVAFFVVLWLGVAGGSMTLAIRGVAGVVGPTGYCSPGSSKSDFAASPITLFINDTCVFIAILWRLLSFSWVRSEDQAGSSIVGLVLGHNLPMFSRAIFQDGQIYYLISIAINLLSMINVTLPSVPTGLHYTYTFSGVIVNMLASRVYRHTKFGHFSEDEISTTFIESQARYQQSTSSWRNRPVGGTTSTENDKKRQWHEIWRSRLLLVSLVGISVALPVVYPSA